ncbi:MAG: bifunctional serine/threonine-protein kinase/formylglycine-generating enzyme family protein [Polyangia bacterium]|nr:bifunctional serine/threonine-protein kinase/formylglycine-generating enzyme family protein [Polyangia bacterium]
MKLCPTCNRQYEGDDFMRCPYDGSNLVDPTAAESDPLIGAKFGESYQIVRIVGEGGMGKVYEARHVRLSKRYAIKILHPQFNSNPETIARFRREAEAATSIGQENILDVIDFNETPQGVYYIVTEFLDGRSLSRALAEDGIMKIPRCLTILHQVTRALAAAHRNAIVHRDLKPENIFLVRRFDSDDFVKVLDFGISKMRSGGDRLTQTGQIIGTPHYMSPEQAQGELNLDHRSDIYSLGAIMYEMFTGRLPYRGDSVQQILVKLLTEELPPPSVQRPDLPSDIEQVILRCMARDPAARYQSMDEVDQALIGLWSAYAGADGATTGQSIGLSSSPDHAPPPRSAPPSQVNGALAPTFQSSPGLLGQAEGPTSSPGFAPSTGPMGPPTGGWGSAGRSTPSPVGQHVTANLGPKRGAPVALILVLLLLGLGGGGGALWYFALRSETKKAPENKAPDKVLGRGQTEPGRQVVRRADPMEPVERKDPGAEPPRVPRPAAAPEGMVLVKGGSFTQGRAKGHKYEIPEIRGVTVEDFYLDETEVTRDAYAAYLAKEGKDLRSPFKERRSPPPGTGELPVTDITWEESAAFCKARGARLPTEAEWEYAARGESHDKLHPWGDTFDPAKAVCSVKAPAKLQPARSGEAHGGFYHLIGNVWEWVSTEAKPYPGNTEFKGVVGTQYVIRGGGGDSKEPRELTATFRLFNYGQTNPKTKKLATYEWLGFRCARSAGANP